MMKRFVAIFVSLFSLFLFSSSTLVEDNSASLTCKVNTKVCAKTKSADGSFVLILYGEAIIRPE